MAKDKPEYIDVETLREAGRLLYGDRWMTQMATALEVDQRTVQRWNAKDAPVPAANQDILVPLLRGRIDEIKKYLAKK